MCTISDPPAPRAPPYWRSDLPEGNGLKKVMYIISPRSSVSRPKNDIVCKTLDPKGDACYVAQVS